MPNKKLVKKTAKNAGAVAKKKKKKTPMRDALIARIEAETREQRLRRLQIRCRTETGRPKKLNTENSVEMREQLKALEETYWGEAVKIEKYPGHPECCHVDCGSTKDNEHEETFHIGGRCGIWLLFDPLPASKVCPGCKREKHEYATCDYCYEDYGKLEPHLERAIKDRKIARLQK